MKLTRYLVVPLTGLVYYIAAWLSVHHTITPEGIAILWLPNAFLLTAFLMLPRTRWPWLASGAIVAELLVDLAKFPLWASISFSLINLFEVTLAALLIQHLVNGPFQFNRLRNGLAFLLSGPLTASMLAGLMGATAYFVLDRADTSYLMLWRLWWFGDALGLLLITPFTVFLWHQLRQGMSWPRPATIGESALLALIICLVGFGSFRETDLTDPGFLFTPVWLLALSVYAAVRFGMPGATGSVLLIALMAVTQLVRGHLPHADMPAQYSVWLTQEFLAIVALASIGLATLLREINEQKSSLLAKEEALQDQNRQLESLVLLRTNALEQTNAMLEKSNARLESQATTDELTGMTNRRAFREMARHTLVQRRPREPVSLIMVDLDHFKLINDTYGHEAGDSVLRGILPPLEQNIRSQDLLGRIGGEEFAILLPGVDAITAIEIAERARKAIESTAVTYHGQSIHVTASFGIAEQRGPDSTLGELLRHADAALYRAKSNGRNRVESYQQETDS